MSDPDTNTDDNQDGTPPGTDEATPNTLEVLQSKLKDIKTEDGRQKYDTLDIALESIVHKDEFIEKLKAEKAEEEALRLTLSEQLEQLKVKKEVETTVTETTKSTDKDEKPSTNGVDETTIASIVAEQLRLVNETKEKEANLTKFQDEVKAEDFDTFLKDKAEGLGLSADFFKGVIEKSPTAALKLIGETSTTSPTKTPSNVRTEAVKPTDDKPQITPNGRGSFGRSSQDKAREIAALRAKYVS